MVVKGAFSVKITPDASPEVHDSVALARMALDKEFTGPLTATSKGTMLSARTPVEGSAGYVAIERVSGTLEGRSGTFVLQHTGVMTRGTPSLTIIVVPDSATGALAGLRGTMAIQILEGKHFYEFDFTFEP